MASNSPSDNFLSPKLEIALQRLFLLLLLSLSRGAIKFASFQGLFRVWTSQSQVKSRGLGVENRAIFIELINGLALSLSRSLAGKFFHLRPIFSWSDFWRIVIDFDGKKYGLWFSFLLLETICGRFGDV